MADVPQQAIVIRKGQTGSANDQPVTAAHQCETGYTASGRGTRPHGWPGKGSRNHWMIMHRDVTTAGFIPLRSASVRRGELSQLTTTSQVVDGLRGSFDNAVCVEYGRRGASWDRRFFGWTAVIMKIRLALLLTLIFSVASIAPSFGGRRAFCAGDRQCEISGRRSAAERADQRRARCRRRTQARRLQRRYRRKPHRRRHAPGLRAPVRQDQARLGRADLLLGLRHAVRTARAT